MIVAKEKIQDFIPQRPPFIMIDNLLEASTEMFKTDFSVLPNNIFLENGVLKEYALIENIAQTSSIGLSITGRFSRDKRGDGYIGGISKLKLYELPKLNVTIYTIVHLLSQFQNMFLVKGENYFNDKKLLECEMKLVAL